MLVLMTLSVIKGDLLIEERAKKSDQGEAATYIPFITHLIRVKLTHDEKLNISQNLYNAYKKKMNGKNVITKEENVTAKMNKLTKKGQHAPQRPFKILNDSIF